MRDAERGDTYIGHMQCWRKAGMERYRDGIGKLQER